MTAVRPRARSHADRAGDPLDGLVNLFDVAIVLAVAFLLVALTALRSGQPSGQTHAPAGSVIIPTTAPQISPGPAASGRGSKVGSVYRTTDGRLIYVPGP